MTNVNRFPSSAEDSNGLPVCLAKASKSFTEPGSVEMISNVWPDCISPSVFFARSIGRGQFNPEASSSRSYSDIYYSSYIFRVKKF